MNKKITVTAVLFLLVSVFLIPASKAQQELYLKAVAEKDMANKMTLLKEYVQKYGHKKDKFLRFVYLNLADTAYKLKNYDEVIQYSEIALQYSEMDSGNKIRLYLSLANSYYLIQKDLDKSFHYADLVIELGNKMIETTSGSSQEKEKIDEFIKNYNSFYIAPANKIQAMILFSKGKDNPEFIKKSAQKAVEAYKAGKSKSYSSMIFSLAVNLFRKKQLDDAIAVVDQVAAEDVDNKYADFMGTLYYKKGKKDEAVNYWEIAYKNKKKIATAMKIGQLVNKQDIDKGIKYFADAFVLSKLDKESDAYKYLEQLYFNKKAKDKSPEEKEQEFKEIINAAKVRLGVN